MCTRHLDQDSWNRFIRRPWKSRWNIAGFHANVKAVMVFFEEVPVGLQRLDLIIDAQIIVELKAVKAFGDIHFVQLRSYRNATKLHVGLLLNFNAPTLAIKRVVL